MTRSGGTAFEGAIIGRSRPIGGGRRNSGTPGTGRVPSPNRHASYREGPLSVEEGGSIGSSVCPTVVPGPGRVLFTDQHTNRSGRVMNLTGGSFDPTSGERGER